MHKDLSEAAGDLASVVEQGEYRASLEALRDCLAAGIASLTPRQMIHLAPLSKQLTDVLKALADLPDLEAVADSVEDAREDVERILRAVQ
jgi:hypothetical protein